MLQKFLKNIVLLLFLNLLIKPFWILGIDREVQNLLGAESYGFYYAVFNFSFLLNILLDLGITNFNNRNISQNNQLLNKHLSGIVILKLLLGVFYLIVSIVAAFIINYSFEHILILLILCFNQFLISFVLYLRSNLSGLHLFKTDSVISVLDRLIMIVVCSILLWGGLPIKLTMTGFALAQTAGYLITAIITLIIVLKKANSKIRKLSWNVPFSFMIIKNSFPFAILILLMTFYNRIDSVMLERMLPNGAEQAGIYASAYRLLDATNMIAYLFAVLLLPMFSKMIKNKDSIENLVKVAFILLFVPALIIASGCFFYAKNLMGLLYVEHVEASALVFRIIMICFIPISITYIFGTLLTANGNLKYLNSVASIGMLINIGINIALIPYFEAVGSAFASLLTQFLTSLVQAAIAVKIFKFKFNSKLVFKLVVIALFIPLIGYLSLNISQNWLLNFGIFVIISFLLVILIRLIKIKSAIQIFFDKS